MDSQEFRLRGKEMVDYISEYLDNIEDRPVASTVTPGYLQKLVPTHAPAHPDTWEDVMKDVERVIMPGVTHWHHPHFHSYYPTANSYAAICGDMLSSGIACIGFTWASSPACTELEVVVLDWLAKMLNLPEFFMSSATSGGVIHGTASEAVLTAMYAARNKTMTEQLNNSQPEEVARNKEIIDQFHLPEDFHKISIMSRMVGYTSEEAHSCVERAGLMTMLKIRKVKTDSKHQMRGCELDKMIQEDKKAGLIPFFVCATLGTTPSCAFDQLAEIGPICTRENIWLHIDAAYAGSAFICPEFRPLLDGVEHAMSFNFNPHKWMQVNFDCSTVWFRDSRFVVDAFNVDPIYLAHNYSGKVPDFRHWQIPLGRRFRSLKLWFVLRLYGVQKLQELIRKHVELAKKFETLIQSDKRFEIVDEVKLGLVCFRLQGDNELTEKLLQKIKLDNRIQLVPGKFTDNQKFFLRFSICHQYAKEEDIDFAYKVISELSTNF